MPLPEMPAPIPTEDEISRVCAYIALSANDWWKETASRAAPKNWGLIREVVNLVDVFGPARGFTSDWAKTILLEMYERRLRYEESTYKYPGRLSENPEFAQIAS